MELPAHGHRSACCSRSLPARSCRSPAQKLSGEYLILLTLAVSSVILGVFTTFPAARRHLRPDRHPRSPSSSAGPCAGRATGSSRRWCSMLGTYAICWRLGESAFGRVLKGIREDGEATQALGKNVFAYKVGVFGITAGLAGLRRRVLLAAGSGWPRRRVFGFSFALTALRDRDLRRHGEPHRHRSSAPPRSPCSSRSCGARSTPIRPRRACTSSSSTASRSSC